MPLHSSASGLQLHEGKRQKEPVRAASTANVTVSAPGATLDGVTLSTGDRILLKNQTAIATNGLYLWMGAATPMQRTDDAALATDFWAMFIVGVREGTTNGATHWVLTSDINGFELETDPISFTNLTNPVFGTNIQAPSVAITGLTGAVNNSRWVGAVNGLAPSSGTFNVGDYVVDRTSGGFWVCVTAGSPGTWRPIGSPADIAGARLYLAANYS